MAGNAVFNRNMRLGGTYYIDDGRPLPGECEKTVDNLRNISPTSFSNVPAAWAMLADAMERDPAFRDTFFRHLGTMGYAAANMPGELWDRLQSLAVQSTGMRIPFTSGYGSTETSPALISLYWIAEGGGILGLPLPGAEIKLVPLEGGRYEIRAKGPNVTPGYHKQPDATALAFDEEGYFCMGDAARFVDETHPVKGLRFAGRVAEDFKLMTGTWVAVGPLRAAVVGAMMPLVNDAVVTGADRAFLGLLAWPNISACRELLGAAASNSSAREIVRHSVVREAVHAALTRYNGRSLGSSTRIVRALLLDEPPSVEASEITDKGYVNQAAVLSRRSADVDRLYAAVPDEQILIVVP
jgi:feruloyl-CoA synthase